MEPKPIKSSGLRIPPRPERYEWEEISNSPPPSTQNILQLFDTTSLARDHPHKYQLLLSQEDGGEQTPSHAAGVDRPRSSSARFVSSPVLAPFRKNKSSVDLKTFFVKNAPQGVTDGTAHVHEALSDADFGMSKLSIGTDKQNSESTNLSSIAQKYAGYSQPDQPEDRRFSLGILPQLSSRTQQDERSSVVDAMLGEPAAETSQASSLPSTSAAGIQNDTACEPNDLVPVSIQPQPRRFLGIGGYFRPLPETMLVPKDAANTQNLTDEIRKRGITAATQDRRSSAPSLDTADCKKKAPTRAEMNMWAPSGM